MSLPAKNIENVRQNIQAKIGMVRAKVSGLRAQQPLLGQVAIGKGQLIRSLQGKRLLRGALLPISGSRTPSTRSQTSKTRTSKMHPGIVDTTDIGHGTPKTTKAAVEQEKGAYPVSTELSVEL